MYKRTSRFRMVGRLSQNLDNDDHTWSHTFWRRRQSSQDYYGQYSKLHIKENWYTSSKFAQVASILPKELEIGQGIRSTARLKRLHTHLHRLFLHHVQEPFIWCEHRSLWIVCFGVGLANLDFLRKAHRFFRRRASHAQCARRSYRRPAFPTIAMLAAAVSSESELKASDGEQEEERGNESCCDR